MEAICSSETSVDNGLHGVISQKVVYSSFNDLSVLERDLAIYERNLSASDPWHLCSVNVYNDLPPPFSTILLHAQAVTSRRLVTSSCYRRTREEELKSAATHQRHQECWPHRQDSQFPLTEGIGYCLSLLMSQHWLQARCSAKPHLC
jgi:hypothetical protein